MTAVHKIFENWFAELTAQVYRWKYAALAGMLLMTVALSSQMVKLKIDTRIGEQIHNDHSH